MNSYIYEVNWYSEIDESKKQNKGIVVGDSYGDAVNTLSRFYGEDEISHIKIEYVSDNIVIEVPEYVNLKDIQRCNEF